MGNFHSKNNHKICDHEPFPGRAVLPHSLNVKAARQLRPTKVETRFLGNPFPEIRTLCAHSEDRGIYIPPQRQPVQEHRNNWNAFAIPHGSGMNAAHLSRGS